ncbi:MAG: type II secretion system inner membrane protein GspF [Gammaproteobacteria bacterium]|nr:type II secretion system inner membrane protein GspF [Gammaproteobacteria bacterium]MCF6229636.1 type II secretion system inner membrane protein GspF [Gammaproteobacteria bacterium]
MAAFEYLAVDEAGREQKGVLEGDAPRQIRQQLREKGWMPLEVNAVKQKVSRRGFSLSRPSRISNNDLAMITRQLATLIRSGVPVEESLRIASQQASKGRSQSVLVAIRSRVLEGHGLAAGMSEFPQIFSEMYRATVAAGEQSGHLELVLERLADYAEGALQVGQKMMLALIYPLALTLVALGAIMFLTAYVVPQVVEVFEGLDKALPPLTIAVIGASDIIRGYWLIMLIILMLGVAGFKYLLRMLSFRRQFHHILLRIPVVSKVLKGVDASRFARTFGTLLGAGVPALEAMNISAQVMSNIPMRDAIQKGARKLREGASLQVALGTGGYFPPIMLHLVASGEASGNVEEMLFRSAETLERELDTLRGTLLGFMEPLIILLMGGLVMVIVMAILMPILDLNQLIQ